VFILGDIVNLVSVTLDLAKGTAGFATEVTESTERGGGKERRCIAANTVENITNIHYLSITLLCIIRIDRKMLGTKRLREMKPEGGVGEC
jgi:hypothetical protein